MSDEQAPKPGDAAFLVAVAADLDDAVAGLEGVRLILSGLASLIRQQAARARRETPQ